MIEDGSKATEEYQGTISIQPYDNKSVQLKMIHNENDLLELYLSPKYKTKVTVPAKRRRFWFDIKDNFQSIIIFNKKTTIAF